MVNVEQFRVPQLLGAVDGGVGWIPCDVQLQGGCVEDIGEIKLLLPRDVGQVSLSFVHSLGQAQLSQVFLEKERK